MPEIKVKEHPDIKQRLTKLRDVVSYEFSDQMKHIRVRLDSTMDLRRVAKIYGTRKPYENSKLSRFYGGERIEDAVLKEYLLSMDLSEDFQNDISFPLPDELPEKFKRLLKADKRIQSLWNNEGKNEPSDVSRTGYDFSLAKECIRRGITDINDLIAILVLRPEGAYQKSGKDEAYIRRTIGSALFK